MQIVHNNGDEFTWTIPITNFGPHRQPTFTVNLFVPDGVSIDTFTVINGTFNGVTEWSGDVLKVGETSVLILKMLVDDITKAPFNITGIVTGENTDTNLTNNFGEDTVHDICSFWNECDPPIYTDNAAAIADGREHGFKYREEGTGDLFTVWNPPLELNLIVELEGAQPIIV